MNSGRLSVPAVYANSDLNTPDSDLFTARQRPGTVCTDAPVTVDGEADWFLNQIGGCFVVMCFNTDENAVDELRVIDLEVPFKILPIFNSPRKQNDACVDIDGVLTDRYDLAPGSVYLIRPDQVVAARWRAIDSTQLKAAFERALGKQLHAQ